MPKARAALAKLTRPHLHAAVKRVRLFKLLDRWKQHSIVWVSGPPGAGKTTLVASYLEVRKTKNFWYQVDEGDLDSASLFYYLAELAKQSASSKRAALPYLSPDYLPDLCGFARRYFRELFQRLGENTVLVLDNCQDAASDTFHLILRQAGEEVPPGSCLIAQSRATVPTELLRQFTNKQLQALGWEELKLTDVEANAIVKLNTKRREAEAVALNKQCDGWIGGLVLLLAQHENGHRGKQTKAFESKEALFNYFAEEVLSRAAPMDRKLLLRTSLFPHITVPMAIEITQDQGAGEILGALYKKQYFIERKVEGELTYQYHDLFREFLLARLSSEYEPVQLTALRQRAAVILELTGRWHEAVELFMQAQDWPNGAKLIRTHAEMLLGHGRWQTLNDWFKNVPEHVIDDDPWLLFWYASAQIPVDPAAAYLSIKRAHAAFVETQDNVGQFYALSKAIMLSYTLGVSFAVFDEWFPKLELQLARLTQYPSIDAGAQAWTAYLMMINLRVGRGNLMELGEHWLTKRFQSNELGQGLRLMVGDQLLHQAIWPVQLELGQSIHFKLKRLAEAGDAPPELRYHATKDLGYWHYFNAEYAESLVFFDRAGQLATQYGMEAQYIFTQCYQVLARCGLGDVHGATAIMKEIAARPLHGDVFSNSAVNWASGVLEATSGNHANAYDRATKAASEARAAGFTLLEIVTEMLAAVYAVDLNRTDEATSIVRHVRELSRDTMWRFPHCLLGAIEAEIHLRQGDKDLALDALQETLRLAQNPRMAAFLVSAKHWLPRQLVLALETGIEVETTRQLIGRFDVEPIDATSESWPWRIRVYTLGRFQILHNGQAIIFSAKVPRKILALLKAVIAYGPGPVAERDLIEALWPNVDGDAGYESLKVATRRLRKLLGEENAIHLKEGGISLNANLCWVDAFAFDESANRAIARELPSDTSACLKLYRGNFLPSEQDQSWSLVMRERLRRRFVHLVVERGKEFEKRADYETARQCYAHGLDADQLVEELYQGLMRCHLAEAKHAEGIETYRRLRNILSVILSVAPNQQSQRLFQALQRTARSDRGRC